MHTLSYNTDCIYRQEMEIWFLPSPSLDGLSAQGHVLFWDRRAQFSLAGFVQLFAGTQQHADFQFSWDLALQMKSFTTA